MKLTIVVFSLSLIGVPLSALAGTDDLPIKDVESGCRTTNSYYPGKNSYDGCMDLAQTAYDYDKLLWSQTSLNDHTKCLSGTTNKYPEGLSFYLYMQGCLEVKIAEYDAKKPRLFNPW